MASPGDLTDELVSLTQFWNNHEDIRNRNNIAAEPLGRSCTGWRLPVHDRRLLPRQSAQQARCCHPRFWDGIGDWRW